MWDVLILESTSSGPDIWYVLLSGFFGVLGAAVGSILTFRGTYHIEELKIKNNEKEQRRQVYSQLHGAKIRVLQSYASYYSAFIESERATGYGAVDMILFRRGDVKIIEQGESILEGMDKLTKFANESIAYQEAIATKRRYEGLQSELANNRGLLWEILGRTQLLFSDINKIYESIDRIKLEDDKLERFDEDIRNDSAEKFGLLKLLEETSGFPSTASRLGQWSKSKDDELNKWCGEKISELRVLIKNLDKSINSMENVIKEYI